VVFPPHTVFAARAHVRAAASLVPGNMGWLLFVCGWGCACLRTCVHGLVCVACIMSSMNRWSDQMCAGLQGTGRDGVAC
jgi:hypothetical protein